MECSWASLLNLYDRLSSVYQDYWTKGWAGHVGNYIVLSFLIPLHHSFDPLETYKRR